MKTKKIGARSQKTELWQGCRLQHSPKWGGRFQWPTTKSTPGGPTMGCVLPASHHKRAKNARNKTDVRYRSDRSKAECAVSLRPRRAGRIDDRRQAIGPTPWSRGRLKTRKKCPK